MTGKSIDFSLCPKFVPNVTDPDTWLEKWNLFHDINKTSEENKLKYVGLIFEGPLRDWLSNLAPNQKDTWGHFTEAFKARFTNKQNDWSKVGQIFQQKQKANQDVREYITNVQKLAAEVELPELQTVQALMKGVNPKLRPDIQKAEPKTIQDFIQAATQAQSIYEDSEDTHAPAVETFISAIEPYFKKQITDLSETLEKKIALSVAAISKPTPDTNKPRMYNNYHAQFQPKQHHQFQIRPTIPNTNYNNHKTFQTNSWQQNRQAVTPSTQQQRHGNSNATQYYQHSQYKKQTQQNNTQQYNPCLSCNGNDHMRRDCPYRQTICNFCGYKGHVEFACIKKQNSQ